MRIQSLFLTFLLSASMSPSLVQAQAPVPLSPAIKQKADAILSKISIEEKIDYIGGTGFAIRAMPNLGLPSFEMSDGPYGVRSNAGFPSTTYAVGIGLAASWDRDLAERVGAGIGKDARARGIHYMLGPGVNIYRAANNGRNFEYFGEDPFLSAAITVGYINGMQKQGVSATIKHYMGNNSEYLRHDSDSIIDERTQREIYLPAFEGAVKQAHVGAIMDSYNLTNGQHMTQNGTFNTDIARKQWGFDGVMMSDWDATYDAAGAANGGLDLEMPTGKFMNRKTLLPAIKDGKVSVATIDEKVRHMLETAGRFGWLDRDQTDLSLSVYSGADQAVALDAAREGMVLLKNDGKLLPLDKGAIKSILIVGPDAYPGVAVGGGSAGVRPFHLVSMLEGISNLVGPGVTVYYDRGLPKVAEMARDTQFQTEATNGQPGVKVENFLNTDLSGAPASTITAPQINTNGVSWESMADDPAALMALFASGAKKERSRRWTGYYTAAKDGPYELVLEGSGEGTGNRVYVDDKLIIENWKIVRAFQPHVTLQLTAGAHKVVVEDWQGSPFGGKLRLGIADQRTIVSAKSQALAAKADVVIIGAGYDNDSESEGGDRTFDLPVGQDELIRVISAANKNTILAITAGGGVDMRPWIDKVPAVLHNWYGGEQGGTALSEVVFGVRSPEGKLPATFDRSWEESPVHDSYYSTAGPDGIQQVKYTEGLFYGYRYYTSSNKKPLFPFGFGLSYTTFNFSGLEIVPKSAKAGEEVSVSFDVTNTGTRDGAEVAQLYVGDPTATVKRPAMELKGFEKVRLAPGEKKHVTLKLDNRSFAYYDVASHDWKVDPGKFTIAVGDSSENTPLKGDLTLSK
jgi:beta-glucosidase